MSLTIILHAIVDKSVESGLKSIRNTVTVGKNPPENREQLQKFPLNLKVTPDPRGYPQGKNSYVRHFKGKHGKLYTIKCKEDPRSY